MDIKEIRRLNFCLLMDDFSNQSGNKTAAAFARHVGKTAPQINNLKSGVDSMGEKIARDLETKFKKPHGWMDAKHGKIAEPAGMYRARPPENPIKFDSGIPAETMLRIINIINDGIGSDVFKSWKAEKQMRTIKALQAALLDLKISGLSDQSILKMLQLTDKE